MSIIHDRNTKQKSARNLPEETQRPEPKNGVWKDDSMHKNHPFPFPKIHPSSFSKVIRPAPIDHDGHNTTAWETGDEYTQKTRNPRKLRGRFFAPPKSPGTSSMPEIHLNQTHGIFRTIWWLVLQGWWRWPCRAPCIVKVTKFWNPKIGGGFFSV